MSKRRKWFFAFLTGLLVVGSAWLAWPERQPSYQGKPLAYWLTLRTSDRRLVGFRADDELLWNQARAKEAVSQIGTNCVPYLLRWVAYEPPAWKTKLMKISAGARWIPERLREDRSRLLSERAEEALVVLGPSANLAIPHLTRLAWDPRRGRSAERAAFALLCCATEIQPIVDLLNHRTAFIRGEAICQIERFGTNALPAIPRLIDCLKDPEIHVAAAAARALGNLQLRPELSVPALTNALQDGRFGVAVVEVEIALDKFGHRFRATRGPQ